MGVPVDLVGHELLIFQTSRQKTRSSTNTLLVSRLFSELMFGSAGLGGAQIAIAKIGQSPLL